MKAFTATFFFLIALTVVGLAASADRAERVERVEAANHPPVWNLSGR